MDSVVRSYCIMGLGNVSGITELLSEISETDVAYVSGSGLVIATFKSAFLLSEIENLLNEEEKSYIIFEMTPGFYSAFIKDENFQNTLFGGPIDNSKIFKDISDGVESIMDLMSKQLADDELFIKAELPDPDMDDILDRINEVGYENISDKEKKLLKKYSEKK